MTVWLCRLLGCVTLGASLHRSLCRRVLTVACPCACLPVPVCRAQSSPSASPATIMLCTRLGTAWASGTQTCTGWLARLPPRSIPWGLERPLPADTRKSGCLGLKAGERTGFLPLLLLVHAAVPLPCVRWQLTTTLAFSPAFSSAPAVISTTSWPAARATMACTTDQWPAGCVAVPPSGQCSQPPTLQHPALAACPSGPLTGGLGEGCEGSSVEGVRWLCSPHPALPHLALYLS